MKQLNSKGVMAAVAAGAIAIGVGVSQLRPPLKVTGTVEIPGNAPPVAVQPDKAPAPPLNPTNSPSAPTIDSSIEPPPVDSPIDPPQISPIPIPERNVKASKPLVTENGIEMVPSDVPITKVTKTAEENLREAFGELTKRKSSGKKKPGDRTSSAMPAGTKLLSLRVDKSGVHIDLSEEFEKSDSTNNMQIRLAEVVYTATGIDRKAKVWISVNGKELQTLGDLEIRQPITRTTMREDFPTIKGAR
jgi:Sporulation and spore germination